MNDLQQNITVETYMLVYIVPMSGVMMNCWKLEKSYNPLSLQN